MRIKILNVNFGLIENYFYIFDDYFVSIGQFRVEKKYLVFTCLSFNKLLVNILSVLIFFHKSDVLGCYVCKYLEFYLLFRIICSIGCIF